MINMQWKNPTKNSIEYLILIEILGIPNSNLSITIANPRRNDIYWFLGSTSSFFELWLICSSKNPNKIFNWVKIENQNTGFTWSKIEYFEPKSNRPWKLNGNWVSLTNFWVPSIHYWVVVNIRYKNPTKNSIG